MKRTYLVLFCATLLSGTIFSQSLSFGPQFGFVKTKDAEKSVMMPGGAIRLNLGGLGVEGAMYYKKDDYNYTVGTTTSTITTKTYPIMLTALLKVLPIIHAEVGIGWYNTKIDYSKLSTAWTSIKEETKNKFAYHIGAGAEIPVGSFIITGDVRYVFYELKLDQLTQPKNLKSDFYAIMVGVMLKL